MNCQTVTDDELEALLPLAAERTVLEIGSWFGTSTRELCRVAFEVWSIDWHGGQFWQFRRFGDVRRPPSAQLEEQIMRPGGGWSLPGFLEQTAREREGGKLVALVGPSHRILPRLRPASFGLIFQDADHTAEGVESDLALALPLLAPGGRIAVHDYGRWGVKAGAEAVLGPPDRLAQSLAVWNLAPGR